MRTKGLSLLESSPALLAGARLARRAARLLFEPGRILRSRRGLAAASELIPAILSEVGLASSGAGAGEEPTVVSATWSGTGAAVVRVHVSPGAPELIVKLRPGGEAMGLQRGAEVLRQLRNDPRLDDFVRLLATPLGQGEMRGQAYTVESALPGSAASVRAVGGAAILPGAASAIGELHRRTARAITVDAAIRRAWIDRPAQVVAQVSRYPERVAAIAVEIGRAWEGRRAVVSWIHGDFWPGNLLVTPTPAAGTIAGIVDWKWAVPDGLPQHDLIHLLIYTRMISTGVEVGPVVRALLGGSSWDPHERRILDAAAARDEMKPAGDRAMLLLFWLRHVSLSLAHSPQFARDWVWMARNVDGVLAGYADGG